MLDSSQALEIIYDRVKEFPHLTQSNIQLPNQPNFKPPTTGLWSRVSVQYGDSGSAGLYKGQLERDFGIINIQCFARKSTGDYPLTVLCKQWRDHFKGFVNGKLEVTMTNAPTEPYPELQSDFIMQLVRINFRVN